MNGYNRQIMGPCLLALAAFVWAPSVAWAQPAMAVEFYHLDGQGNVLALTDWSGQVVESHDYDVFGQEVNPQAGTQAPQPKRFAGKERDTETGWDYFGARYYGSKIGRFTTVDPVYTWQENLVDPQRWNRYAYARNNPLRYVDPDGKVPILAVAAVVWGVYEVGSQIYDAYTAYQTVTSPTATTGEKAAAVGGFAIGAIAPGGGYGTAAKVAASKVDDAVDLAKGGTYLLKNSDDVVMRTGRSKDLARRAGDHRRAEATKDLEFQVDRRTDVYAEQRGREQMIHDAHKPPLDKVNPIGPRNPRRQEYLDASKRLEQK